MRLRTALMTIPVLIAAGLYDIMGPGFDVSEESVKKSFMVNVVQKHPWVALLGWLPPVYIIGFIRCFGKTWCTTTNDWFLASSPHPILWWPHCLYTAAKDGRSID